MLYKLKDVSETITYNNLFIDFVLKKKIDGNVRERWDVSGKLKFFAQEAIDLRAQLLADQYIVFTLTDSSDNKLCNIEITVSNFIFYEYENILECNAEFRIGYDIESKYKALENTYEQQVNWMEFNTPTYLTDVRVRNLGTISKTISIFTSNPNHPAAKNNYTFSQTINLGGGSYEHKFIKQICKFLPSGCESGNFAFKDDYIGVGQDNQDTDFLCYDGYYSTQSLTQLTTLYADLNHGFSGGTMLAALGASEINNTDVFADSFWCKYLYNYESPTLIRPYEFFYFFDCSDVKRFWNTEKATKNLVSLKEVLEMFKIAFDLDYRFLPVPNPFNPSVNIYYLQLVHPSQNLNPQTVDLTNFKNVNWTKTHRKTEYTKERKFIIQEYNSNQSEPFVAENYTSTSKNYVTNEIQSNNRFVFDVKDVIENPDKYSDDDIVVVAGRFSSLYARVIDSQNDFGDIVKPNGYMLPNILRKLHKTYNHYQNESFLFADLTSANATAGKFGKLENMFAPLTFNEADLTKLYNTDLGLCKLENYETRLDGSFARLELFKQ